MPSLKRVFGKDAEGFWRFNIISEASDKRQLNWRVILNDIRAQNCNKYLLQKALNSFLCSSNSFIRYLAARLASS